jgi:predicted RNA-binding protein
LCESNVYIRDDEGEKLVMEDAVLVENEGGIIKVTDILGGGKFPRAPDRHQVVSRPEASPNASGQASGRGSR